LTGLLHLALNLVSLHVKSWRLEQRAGTLAYLTTLASAVLTTSLGKPILEQRVGTLAYLTTLASAVLTTSLGKTSLEQ
jgi:hypothetical protein